MQIDYKRGYYDFSEKSNTGITACILIVHLHDKSMAWNVFPVM